LEEDESECQDVLAAKLPQREAGLAGGKLAAT